MAIQDEIDATNLAILVKLQALIASGSTKDMILAAKAVEALRGGLSLQAIIDASESGQTAIAAALAAALNSITAGESTAEDQLTDLKSDLAADLNSLASSLSASYLSGANAIGNPRIGDIWLALYPDPTVLPANVSICDGRYVPLADSALLTAAWGLDGSAKTFVTNYNAGVASDKQIILDGTGIRLPDLRTFFFKPGTAANVGIIQAASVPNHVHGSDLMHSTPGSGTLAAPAAGTGITVGSSGNPTVVGDLVPANISALPLIRFK